MKKGGLAHFNSCVHRVINEQHTTDTEHLVCNVNNSVLSDGVIQSVKLCVFGRMRRVCVCEFKQRDVGRETLLQHDSLKVNCTDLALHSHHIVWLMTDSLKKVKSMQHNQRRLFLHPPTHHYMYSSSLSKHPH